MLAGTTAQPTLDIAAHVIQLALTPVFLLTAIAALLGVFAGRHAHVSDQVARVIDSIAEADAATEARLRLMLRALRLRSVTLVVAVVFAALAGACTCAVALVLFVEVLLTTRTSGLLFGLFGFALSLTAASLAAFAMEIAVASRTVRAEAGRHT